MHVHTHKKKVPVVTCIKLVFYHLKTVPPSIPWAMSSFQWDQWKQGTEGSIIFTQLLKHHSSCLECKVSCRILPGNGGNIGESYRDINAKGWGRYNQGQSGQLSFPDQEGECLKKHIIEILKRALWSVNSFNCTLLKILCQTRERNITHIFFSSHGFWQRRPITYWSRKNPEIEVKRQECS
jgi:hypothetical protein